MKCFSQDTTKCNLIGSAYWERILIHCKFMLADEHKELRREILAWESVKYFIHHIKCISGFPF